MLIVELRNEASPFHFEMLQINTLFAKTLTLSPLFTTSGLINYVTANGALHKTAMPL